MLRIVVAICLTLAAAPCAQAQWGKLLREGAEYLGKKALKEGAQEAAEAGGKKLVREAAQETGEQLLKKSGLAAARFSDDAAKAIAQHGDSMVPLINQFGDDAARAVTQVSGRSARRLAMMTEELAATPQGAQVLQKISQGGKAEQIVEFLWSHRGKLTTTAVVATLLASTDEVLAAGKEVSIAAVETTGESLVEPMVEQVAPTLATLLFVVVLVVGGGLLLAATSLGVYAYRNTQDAMGMVRRLSAWMRSALAPKKA